MTVKNIKEEVFYPDYIQEFGLWTGGAVTASLPPLKVIAADGEQKAAQALKDAADVMSVSSAALQLRYLQAHKGSSLPV